MPVLRNIAQLATCPPGNPQEDAGLITNGAIAWQGGTIQWVCKPDDGDGNGMEPKYLPANCRG